MRKLLLAVAAAAVVAVPVASRAGFDLGFRVGYAAAGGDFGEPEAGVGTLKLTDFTKSAVPFEVDAGWRGVSRHLTLGGYLSFGPAMAGGNFKSTFCDLSGVDCSGYQFRIGIQGIWNFLPDGQFDPWVGIGTGYEMVSVRAEDSTDHIQYTAGGWEMMNLQAGLDFRIARHFALGPFLSLAVSQYGSWDIDSSFLGNSNGDMYSKSTHTWFQFGVRANFNW